MLDVAKRRWSRGDARRPSGIDAELLPRVFESPDVCARVSREAAALTGLREGTPIVAGAGDQAAGAVGMGITRPGAVSATIGTSGVVFAATDRPALDPKGRLHTFCHAIPGRWHVMGVTQAAGLSLRWLRDQWRGADGRRVLRPADRRSGARAGRCRRRAVGAVSDGRADAASRSVRPRGPRRPRREPHARARRARRARRRRVQPARHVHDLRRARRAGRAHPSRRRRRALGALARRFRPTVYGHPVETVAAEEGAAYGAALLAGVGVGIWPMSTRPATRSCAPPTSRRLAPTRSRAHDAAVRSAITGASIPRCRRCGADVERIEQRNPCLTLSRHARNTSSRSVSGPSATAAAIRSATPSATPLAADRRGQDARRGRRVGRQPSRQRSRADRRHALRARPHRQGFQEAPAQQHGIVVPMATVNLFFDPVFRDGAFTANDPRVRAYAVQKTMRAMDLGAELGAKIFVLWGGREGTETDACRGPDEAVKRLREAINYLCEYSIDQKYGYQVRARGQTERAARRYLHGDDGRLSRPDPDARRTRRWSASIPKSRTSTWPG